MKKLGREMLLPLFDTVTRSVAVAALLDVLRQLWDILGNWSQREKWWQLWDCVRTVMQRGKIGRCL
jgi:hypothetical protein